MKMSRFIYFISKTQLTKIGDNTLSTEVIIRSSESFQQRHRFYLSHTARLQPIEIRSTGQPGGVEIERVISRLKIAICQYQNPASKKIVNG